MFYTPQKKTYRAPTKEINGLVQANPQYGYAFQNILKAAQNGMSPEEIIKRVQINQDP